MSLLPTTRVATLPAAPKAGSSRAGRVSARLRRRPERVFVASADIAFPPARSRDFKSRWPRVGLADRRRAAAPVTCGVAMDVPEKLSVYVLRPATALERGVMKLD